MAVRQVVPRRIRSALRERHRALVLRRAVHALERDRHGSDRVWRELGYGWGNEGFAPESDYLAAVAAAAAAARGPILECGSGLTTIVLAAVAGRSGAEVWTLESEPEWHGAVVTALTRLGLPSTVRLAPLRDYGEFDWYDVEPQSLPDFALVVCDGPAGRTRGGRYGLLPVVGDRVPAGTPILLDDVDRAGERDVLRRWEGEGRVRVVHEARYAVAVATAT